MRDTLFYIAIIVLLGGVIATYSNHFDNGFHFDDMHTIVENLYIRDISNIPQFFVDGNTRSTLPTNQAYRPILTTTLAIDYWLGGELKPFWFHMSTFFWFLVQGVLMFFVFKAIMNKTIKHIWNKWFALLAVAWFMLHTANAETINYVIARSDSLSTLAVVAGLFMYIKGGILKRYFLYLIPILLGILIKPTVVMFAPILIIYILFFELNLSVVDLLKLDTWKKLKPIYLYGGISLILGFAFFGFTMWMTPKTWQPGGFSWSNYATTQPWVMLRYVHQFIMPTDLSADTDWGIIKSMSDDRFIVGSLFVVGFLSLAVYISKFKNWRPVAFGIFWFFLALLPSSSVVPLSEVTNDHRMFFPFVGLVLSAAWTIGLFVIKYQNAFKQNSVYRYGLGLLLCLMLAGYAYGTYQRNEVWQEGETLWYDVTVKSPKNGRGLMNYGLVLMRRGDYKGALNYYNKALKYTPDYPYLHVNMAIVINAMGDKETAKKHFEKAYKLNSALPVTNYYYGNFLFKQGNYTQAKFLLKRTIQLSPAHKDARKTLLTTLLKMGEIAELKAIAQQTLDIYPGDQQVMSILEAAEKGGSKIGYYEALAKSNPTADNFIELSMQYYKLGEYDKSIGASNSALEIDSNNHLAHNNICSAYNMLKNWDKAIEACAKAIEIKPDFQLAKNNMAWAEKQKEKGN